MSLTFVTPNGSHVKTLLIINKWYLQNKTKMYSETIASQVIHFPIQLYPSINLQIL